MQSTPSSAGSAARREQIVVPLSALALVVLVWWSGPLAYPLRLFTTIVHELAHGAAALLSGGDFLSFQVNPDGSGLAYTRGGSAWLIIPAGYLGAALVGALMIRVGRRPNASRWMLGVLGVVTAGMTLRFALPTLFVQFAYALLTLVAGLGCGLALTWAALRLSEGWNHWLLTILGFWLGLSSLQDLLTLFALSTTLATLQLSTDAASMAELTGVPAVVWAVIWFGAAVWAVGWALLGRVRR